MSIRANILRIKKQILNEIDESQRPRSDEVKQKSLLAVRKGMASDEWKDYMLLFVDDPNAVGDAASISAKQLARLMGQDATKDDPAFDEKRAYLAADGPCTVETITNFGRNASEVLDIGLSAPAPPATPEASAASVS
jgi:hypothetical protein